MSVCMSGTRGSGVLSSTGDVLVRGVGGVCDMCMCLARGGVGGEGGEWMRELVLGFTNPLGTGGVLDMCLRGFISYRRPAGSPPTFIIAPATFFLYPSIENVVIFKKF